MENQINAAATTTETVNNTVNQEATTMTIEQMAAQMAEMKSMLQDMQAQRQAELQAAYEQGVVEAKLKEPVRVETSGTVKLFEWGFDKIVRPVVRVGGKIECGVRNQGHEKVLEYSAKTVSTVKRGIDKLDLRGQGWAKKSDALKADRLRSEEAYKATEEAKAAVTKAYEEQMALINAKAAAMARG